jgi:hypothetical protein
MKKFVLSFICMMLISFNSDATILLSGKDLIPITITMNDGQIKKGNVNSKFDPENKIKLIQDDGKEETISSEDVKEFTISTAQGELIYENVVYYSNIKNTRIASKPIFMMVLVRTPSPLTMYLQVPWKVAYGDAAAASMYNTTNYYAKREGESVASLLSSVMMGQVNPNAVFRNSAPEYFADYPELANKIKNKTYTYAEIMTVAMEYIKWKVGAENFKVDKN